VAWVLAGVTSTAALASYIALSPFNRWVADDYGYSAMVTQHGWWGGQVAQYTGWSGRFTSNATIMGTVSLGPWSARVVPALVILVWLAALLFLARELASALRIAASWTALLVGAGGVLVASLAFAPDLFESVYWITGAMTYAVPLIGATVLGALLIRAATAQRSRWELLIAMLIALLAGGCCEPYAVIQVCTVAVMALLALRRTNRLRTTACAVLIASLLSLLAVAVAPGNAIREAALPPHPTLADIAWPAVVGGVQCLLDDVEFHPLGVLAALAIGTVIGVTVRRSWQPPTRLCLAALVLAIATWMVTAAMTDWASSSLGPARALLTAAYVTVLAITIVGVRLGAAIGAGRPLLAKRSSAVLVGGIILAITIPVAGSLPAMQRYAQASDLQAAALRAAAHDVAQRVTVNGVSTTSLGVLSFDPGEELSENPRYFVNEQCETYYGIPTVVAGP
jgi:hypothetical protein